MNPKILIAVLSALVAIEIISTFIVKWTVSRQERILQNHLAGQTMGDLAESQREKVLKSAAAEYDSTIYRKIDLLVIGYHIPALASWGIITRQSMTPPLYYYGATMFFWLALSIGAIKALARFRGG